MTKNELLKLLNTPGIEVYHTIEDFQHPLKLVKSYLGYIVTVSDKETYNASLEGLKLIIGD